MTDLYTTYENLSSANKKLVGLRQEVLLRADKKGGEDGMWFERSLNEVVEDRDTVLAEVAKTFNLTVADVLAHINS